MGIALAIANRNSPEFFLHFVPKREARIAARKAAVVRREQRRVYFMQETRRGKDVLLQEPAY